MLLEELALTTVGASGGIGRASEFDAIPLGAGIGVIVRGDVPRQPIGTEPSPGASGAEITL
jgi:hypothetical protein